MIHKLPTPSRFIFLLWALAVLPMTAQSQAPKPDAYAQLLELSGVLDSTYQSQMELVRNYMATHKAKAEMANGIITGIDPSGRLIYTIDHNDGAARAVRTATLYPGGDLGFSLTGKGMVVGIWENGAPEPSHPEFENRLLIRDQTSELRGHATHVSGTILAAGINPGARGMAYEATGHVFSASNYLSEVATAAADGLLVSNHSYGVAAGWTNNTWRGDPEISTLEDWKFGIYNEDAAILDRIAVMAPYYLLIRSAGNDRGESGDGTFPADGPFDTMTGEAIAKNILSVGNVATRTDVPTQANDVELVSSSSWGPADDGRIKPDLVAPGANLLSPDHEVAGGYDLKTGTSMSTPVTTGNAVLLQQLHQQLTGRYMKAATLKGLLLHTTLDVGSGPGPDYMYGHGLLNTRFAARVISEQSNVLVEELSLPDGESLMFEFEVTSEDNPLIVSISWTDPAATPFETAVLDPTDLNLINDLDLRVTTPDGIVEQPWILDPANPGQNATKGDNFRDNYEKIVIPAPQPGKYQILINHKNVLRDGPQQVSLLATALSETNERATYYWIGGNGLWQNGNNWSDEPDGSGVGEVPGPDDRVIIEADGLAEGEVISLNAPASVYQMTWLGAGMLNLDGHELQIASGLQSVDLRSEGTGKISVIPPNDQRGFATIDGSAEELVLEFDNNNSDFVLGGQGISLSQLRLASGKLTVKDNFSASEIVLTGDKSKELNLGGLEIHSSILNFGDLSENTVNLTGSHLSFSENSGAHELSFEGVLRAGDITVEEGSLSVRGSVMADTLTMAAGTALELNTGQEVVVGDLQLNGSAEAGIVLEGSGGAATITSNALVKYCFDYLTIDRVNSTGEAKFVVEGSSTVTGSQGWIEDSCEQVLFAGFSFRSPCAGGTTFFEDLSDGNPDSWRWDFGDGNTSELQNPIHNYEKTGTYVVALEVVEGGESSTLSLELEIVPSTITETPTIVLENGRLLTNSAGNAFQWYLNDEPLPGETSRLFGGSVGEGTYRVEVTNGACSAISEVFIVTSTDDDMLSEFIIIPNPVIDDQTWFQTSQAGFFVVSVLDLSGKELKRLNFRIQRSGERVQLLIEDLQNGMYLLHVSGQDKHRYVERFKVMR